jgi:hypothetical protein
MRGFKALGFAAVASVLLAGSLQAQATQGWLQWYDTGLNPLVGRFSNVTEGANDRSVYTSPYRAQFRIDAPASPLMPPAGDGTFGPPWDIFCIDYANTALRGPYVAYFTNLSSTADLGKTRLGSGGLAKYLAAAYLSQEISTLGFSTAAEKAERNDINGAIWQIMTGTPFWRRSGTGWVNTRINELWSEAYLVSGTDTWRTANASNWVVVTDEAAVGRAQGGSQEYLTQVTPEPATMLLLGTGLVVMLMAAGALRRPTV